MGLNTRSEETMDVEHTTDPSCLAKSIRENGAICKDHDGARVYDAG